MGYFQQFGLILWKNWILQKRKKCVTVFEILLPTIFAGMIIAIRAPIKPTIEPVSTMYEPFALNADIINGTNLGTEILYSPDTAATRLIVARALNILSSANSTITTIFTAHAFADETAMLLYYRQSGNQSKEIHSALVFDDWPQSGSTPKQLNLRIRPPTNAVYKSWRTEYLFGFYSQTRPRVDNDYASPPHYYESGFMAVQYAVTMAFIEMSSNVNVTNDVTLMLERMPYPPYNFDAYNLTFSIVTPMMIMLSFILNALQSTRNLVFEKERKLKESMKMMGLTNIAHWSAWFFKCFVYLFLAMALFTGLFAVPVGPGGTNVIGHTDLTLFFVFLLCYATSIVSFCFLISTLFRRANAGSAAGGVLFVLAYSPYFAIQGQYQFMTFPQKVASCLLFNVAMGMGCNVISIHEGLGEGAQWSNFGQPATVDDNFSLLIVMIMLLVDTGIYLLFTWYVDAVMPGEYGVPQPWYFPILRSYWCGVRTNAEVDPEWDPIASNTKSEFFEKDPTGLQKGISIQNLRKEFGSGSNKVVAVNGMSLNMYKGQITALLGHNGAGKTTTMSMLTGFIPATSGTAVVNGFNINRNIVDVRKTLGLCPQHDILFDTLTVREHLIFFSKLKGSTSPKSTLDREINEMIDVLGLTGKGNSISMTLSGGQKRKLSVGIALIGGSEVVILDEPTSGMDPQARRQIWTILQKYKESRTILFTTHFMDEADILGDWIAIMAEGVVKCCGTSLFLKGKYGSGYHLTIVKMMEHCDLDGIGDLIQRHVPKAMQKSNIGAELTYVLPNEESGKFEELFRDMENASSKLGIASFGASVTTMEEVFLKVGESGTDDGGSREKSANGFSVNKHSANGSRVSPTMELKPAPQKQKSILDFNKNLEKNTGMSLHFQQFHGAFMKKVLHTWRNPTMTLVQLLLPTVFTCLAMTVANITSAETAEPPITLNMSGFQDNQVAYAFETAVPPEPSRMANVFISTLNGSQSTPLKVDLTQYNNMTDFFLQTGLTEGISVYNKRYLLGGLFEAGASASQVDITGFFNGQSFHTSAISVSYLLNTMAKYFVGSDANVITVNDPLPKLPDQEKSGSSAGNLGISFSIAFCVLFGMAFLASSFVIFLVRERENQAKHIQIVSGLRPITFWMSNLTWDYITYLVPCLCLVIVFAAFQTDAYSAEGRLGYIFVILLLFGWAILPYVYLWSYFFKTPAGGMVALVMLNILTGLVILLVVFMLSFQGPESQKVAELFRWIFGSFLPNYCLGQSFMDFYSNYLNLKICEGIPYKQLCQSNSTHACCAGCEGGGCIKFQEDFFSMATPGVGRFALYMAIQGGFYFILVLMVEYGVFRKFWYCIRSNPEFPVNPHTAPDDSDVAQEKQRINSTPPSKMSDSLVLQNVVKYYGDLLAVDRLCLGVPKDECFGLLGVNGAGKTSTFKMLTGEEMVSDGNAYINGYDVREHTQQVHEHIGYCPQFDALIDQMTGRETLTMYARLRGIKGDRIRRVVNQILETMLLQEYADKETRTYSGGNKRKLSTAVSLIGDPPVVFLDEPTTGVDPAARRQLWNVLSDIRASGRTLILTSHSMEECDALCTRIAIMVNGRFLCLGSPQHLKNKFGKGYTLIARIGDSDIEGTQLETFERFIETTFPSHQKVDSSNGYVNYHLTDPSVPLSYIFGTLERAKSHYNIDDYSVSQTTLQQVFIDFAKTQVPPQEEKSTSCCKSICCCCCCCSSS